MNTKRARNSFLVIAGVTVLATLAFAAWRDTLNGEALVSGTGHSLLSQQEVAGLVQMREEEKLARDVYAELGALWGANIFSNIAASEQTHTDAVKALLERYGIKDPVTSDAAGSFSSQSMRALYEKLMQQGRASLADAFQVGAAIEDLDISDLEALEKATDNADILLTYGNLQRGSGNHMRAFVRNIQSLGGSYAPQYISESEYESIVSK